MGLSVASLNPVASQVYVASKPQAYTIDNESAVSSAYKESLKNTVTPEGVRGPAPVQYATSRRSVSASAGLSANQRMNRAYNAIANAFNGVNTSYDRNSQASAYETLGQSVDMFA